MRLLRRALLVLLPFLTCAVEAQSNDFNPRLLFTQTHPQRVEQIVNEVTPRLKTMIGKDVYNAGDTRVYEVTDNVEELFNSREELRNRVMGIGKLEPMKLIDATIPHNAFVVLTVQLKDGRKGLLLGDFEQYDHQELYKPTFLERLSVNALQAIPSSLSKREITAIKQGRIYRGMSENAAYILLGLPERENDWGRAGRQWIFPGNHYIYLQNGRVTDWQHIE